MSNFVAPATSQLPKLYVVSTESTPIYVGVTKQSILARLRGGFTAQGQHGYHDYEWRYHLEVPFALRGVPKP